MVSCQNKTASKNSQNTLQAGANEPIQADVNQILRDSLAQLNDRHFSYSEDYPINTTLDFKEFGLDILNYQVQNEVAELTIVSTDTIELHEWVGSNLMNRKINIRTTNKDLKFQIDYCLNDKVYEQYDPSIVHKADKKWDEWRGFTPYKSIKIKDNTHLIFPDINLSTGYLKFRKKQLNLRDTFVNLSGESDNIATVVYKEKPSIYDVESVFIRITAFEGNKKKWTKYLKFLLSKGC